MNETVLRIRSVFVSKGTDDAEKAFRSLRDTIKNAGGSVKNANTIFSNFFGSLTRIAKLRMLRGIIRGITSAVKEGVENIYRYSQALGAADASHFANTMDSLASSMLYMKNSIGAVVAPLLTSLLPAIQTIVNWFVTATQVVAQFFAALGGQTMYTRAKEHATAWKSVEGAAGGAAAAAKEYQNTILSFDEIHALNDVPSSGGGGGGGGASPLDYADMFEEAEISAKIKKLAQWLRDNFDGILDIVKAIGIALLGWKIAQNVADFFAALGVGSASMLRTVGLGLTLLITGVSLSAKGGFDIGYDGVDLMDIIKSAIGAAMGGVGGAFLSVALGASAGAGFVVGFTIALLGTIIGIQLGQQEKMLDATYRTTEEYQNLVITTGILEEILSHSNTVVEVWNKNWKEYSQLVSDIKLAEYLIPQIEELGNKTERTELENEKLKTLIEQLNGLGIDGVTASYDEATGAVQLNTQEVKKNLDAVLKAAKEAAYIDVMKAAWEDEARATLDAKMASEAYEDTLKIYNDTVQESLDYQREYQNNLDPDIVAQYDEKIGDLADQLDLAEKAQDEANKRMEEARDYADRAEKAYHDLKTEVDYLNQSIDVFNGKTINNVIEAGLNGIKNSAYWAYWQLQGVNEQILQLSRATFGGLSIGIYAALGKANGGFVNGYANGGIIPRFDGGGINSADLFLARENNAPELVGRIGNRTAVANQDQIGDVLTAGVIRGLAMMQEGQGSSNTEVNVYMDREVLARAVDKGNRSLNRRFNVSLA